jgi:nicotinamide-nucleotide amidase
MEILDSVKDIVVKLTKKNLKLAIAESCTGGYISNAITNISGASKVFECGVICYSNNSKIDLLNVDPDRIDQFGAVSEIVAKQLAHNIRVLSNVDIGIGITGIAGPTGGTAEKPVGLVFIGFSTIDETFVEKHQFNVDRITFKAKILEQTLLLLQNFIK